MQGMIQLLESGDDSSFDFLNAVVAAAKEHLDADVAFLGGFRGDREVIKAFVGDSDAAGFGEGTSFPLKDTYCQRVATGVLPAVIEDARGDERVRELAITERLGIGSYVGVPVILPGGRLFGMLCVLNRHPDPTIRERDVQFMRVLANILGNHLGRLERENEDLNARRERIRTTIGRRDLRMVFQPIVDLQTRRIVGAEALARFDAEPRRPPDHWFAEAAGVGLGNELEIVAVQSALAQLDRIPEDFYLSVNVSPATLQMEALFESLAASDPARIVVEVTEHAIVKEYEPLIEAVKRLNDLGSRLAVDDAGAGYSGLGHIIRVTPEILKLDVSLTRDVYQDPIKQALATAAVAFAARVGMSIVAEGVETEQDALALQLLGVGYGQGYCFSKPGPLPLEIVGTSADR